MSASGGVTILLTDDLVRELHAHMKALGLLPEPEAQRQWLTAKQAAEYVGVSTARIHSLVSEGRLPRKYPKGHKARFSREDLDAHMSGGRA